MRLRMIFLLLVATVSGTVVGLAENARAGKRAPPCCRPPAPLPIDTPPNPCPVPRDLRDEFRAAAARHRPAAGDDRRRRQGRVEPRHRRRSSAGAHGLLQVLPSTAAEFELDTYHVGENVLAGARYLRQLLDRFESTELALAAYNAGPTAVERKGARPNDETVAYVANVTTQWRKLVGCT